MFAINVENDDDRTLVWRETPTPAPRAGEVLVEVHATAVNRADLLQRRGSYAPPPGASHVLGLEAAGVVVAVTDGVDPTWVGKRVLCLLSGGGYAEQVAVPADHLLQIPGSLSFTDAAAIPEVFYTAFINLFLEGGLKEGETVMIHAAASGVGTAALQLARMHGCTTIATASGGKLAELPALGADHLVDRKTESFADRVQEITEGRGVDVILDPVGATYLADDIASLARRGRLVIIGLLGGTKAELDLARVLRHRLRIVGSVLRSRSDDEKTAITSRFRAEVMPQFADGTLRPVIHEVLPIQRANEAHERLKSNETTGKVVLQVR